MNLVKAQEYAQSLPLAELKKYADGFNPAMIPPWLATGEMQAKMKRAEMANTLQGAANGPQPSVKEQVEQKAGILALQQAQQQAQAQQMMQPRMGAGPVPDGTPQPRPQPQREAGLNQLPSNIQMAGGGIVAFAEGDKVEGEDEDGGQKRKLRQVTQRELAEEYNRKRFAQQAADEAARSPEATKDSEGIRKALAFVASLPVEAVKTLVSAPGYGFSKDSAPRPAAQATGADMGMPTNVGLPASTNVAAMQQPAPTLRAGIPKALPAAQTKPAAAPAAPTAPAPDSMEAMYRTALANAPKDRTADEIMAEQKAIRASAGLGEPAGKAQLERIAALQKQYEASKPSGLDELIRVFGQAGASKGLSGTGPAYTAMQAQKRAQDLEMAQKINELMGGVETTQRAEAKDLAGKVGESREKTLDRGSQFNREKMQSLGTAFTSEAQRKTQERGQDLNFRAAMAQVAATAARNNMELTANQRASIADKALDNVNATLKANMKLQMAVGNNPALMQQLLKAETDRLMGAAGGATMATAPSAASPSGTSLKYNPKTGKIE